MAYQTGDLRVACSRLIAVQDFSISFQLRKMNIDIGATPRLEIVL